MRLIITSLFLSVYIQVFSQDTLPYNLSGPILNDMFTTQLSYENEIYLELQSGLRCLIVKNQDITWVHLYEKNRCIASLLTAKESLVRQVFEENNNKLMLNDHQYLDREKKYFVSRFSYLKKEVLLFSLTHTNFLTEKFHLAGMEIFNYLSAKP